MRSVAAFGLGLAEPDQAVDALVRALGDPSTGTTANAIWALGRMEDGRAVRPVTARWTTVRRSCARPRPAALGHLDSASAVPALLRMLKSDPVASVRRAAAWALGQLEAAEAADALAAALRSRQGRRGARDVRLGAGGDGHEARGRRAARRGQE